MTKIARRRKIDSWEYVKEKIKEILENVPEHTNALSLPYGLQSLYTVSHQEPVRIMIHPNMNDYDTFVTHHGKAKKFYLNLWTVNHKDSCSEEAKIKQQKVQLNYQIKHIAYVPAHRCFVAFATDLTLRVFATIKFTEMSRVQTSHTVLCLFYNACRDDVLTGCLGFVMIWKFPQAQNSCLVPTQKIECPSILPDYWVIWIKVDKPSRQLLLNCEEAIVILDESSYELRYNFKIDFRHRLPFSACAFYHPSCYFITGSKDYSVKVWNTSLKQCPLVTTFNGHCNVITAVEVDVANHLVISSSSDKTIRLWCLETFAQTYCLETGEEVHRMELMTLGRMFYQSDEHIRVWNLNHFHTLFTVLGFEIVSSRRVKSLGCPTRLLLQGEDGAIRIVSPTDGTVITTMFPLEMTPENIVDYAYNPREDRLYVVLSSGAILVFRTNTNPCSAYEVWKSQVPDERVISVAMMNIDAMTETADVPERYTLLFAGLENGHIALVYSNELTMNDSMEAHYGPVVLLRVSQNCERTDNESAVPDFELLVSCGADCLLKVWKVVHTSHKVILLEMWSVAKLASVPRDMDLIGFTMGLIMDDNSLVTCRVNSEAVRLTNTQGHRDSISRYEQYDVECFTCVAEEKHSKSISGLSACPTLGLFATSSDDWSVKIWNTKAKLVKEICFDESLRGVCFANPRGDLLVGFQSHISIVPLTNYLPLNYLEMLSTMTFPDDVFEDNLPFDRMLSFSYNPLHTPCLPLDLEERRASEIEQGEIRIKPVIKIPSAIFLTDDQGEETTNDIPESARRYSTTQEQDELDEKLRKFQKSSLSRRSSTVQSPLLEEVIARITQSFSSRSELNAANDPSCASHMLLEQLRKLFDGDDDAIPEDYWPCAPDGYIPNSVIRDKIKPKELPAHLVPRLIRGDELKDWIETTQKKDSKDGICQLPEDPFSPIAIDDDIEFFSIFDGYKEPSPVEAKPQPAKEEKAEEDEDEDEEEADLRKKWKATRTTMNKDAMVSIIRTRQLMKERKKVSKKPDMPIIMAEEEEEEEDDEKDDIEPDHEGPDESDDSEKSEMERDVRYDSNVPQVLMQVLHQPWFPKDSLEGVSPESIFNEMINVMSSCAPLTYNKICDAISSIQTSIGLSDSLKEKTLNLLADNLAHPSAAIRRASLSTVKDFNCVSSKVLAGIVGCLNHKSVELQHDALKALEHLMGIRDKEALRDLFISLNIISRPTSPDRRPSLTHIKDMLKRAKGLGEISDKDWRIDKEKFVRDWLAPPAQEEREEEEEEDARELNVSGTESRNVQLATSIMSKLKMCRKEPRLSITNLVFEPDSSSSRTSSTEEELGCPEYAGDLIDELKRTRAGYKLLSRMGYKRMSFDGATDLSPIYEDQEEYEKGPPYLVKGLACSRMDTVKDQRTESQDRIPEIRVSSVLSEFRGYEQKPPDLNKLVLPKIFNLMKTFRQNLADVRGFRGKTAQFSRSLLTVPDKDGIHGKAQLPCYATLPAIRNPSPGLKSTAYLAVQDDAVNQKPSEPLKLGKRLRINDESCIMDSQRRKSILKDLQKRRINISERHGSSPTQSSETTKTSTRPSPESLPDMYESTEPVYGSASLESVIPVTSDLRLPNIDVHSKLDGSKRMLSGRVLVEHGHLRSVAGTSVQPVEYAYPRCKKDQVSKVAGERLLHSLRVRAKKSAEELLRKDFLRVFPIDSKLTVDTGRQKWGRSRFGILEVLWTAMSIYEDNREQSGSAMHQVHNITRTAERNEHKPNSRHFKSTPMTVRRVLKPIKNRNLVTNPYTNNAECCVKPVEIEKRKCSTATSVNESLSSDPQSNSASCSKNSLTKSKQHLRTEALCTIRELLNVRGV